MISSGVRKAGDQSIYEYWIHQAQIYAVEQLSIIIPTHNSLPA